MVCNFIYRTENYLTQTPKIKAQILHQFSMDVQTNVQQESKL